MPDDNHGHSITRIIIITIMIMIIIIIIVVHAVSDRNTQWRGSFSIEEIHFAIAAHPSQTQYNPEKKFKSRQVTRTKSAARQTAVEKRIHGFPSPMSITWFSNETDEYRSTSSTSGRQIPRSRGVTKVNEM